MISVLHAIIYTGFEILNSKNDFAIFNYLTIWKNIQDNFWWKNNMQIVF